MIYGTADMQNVPWELIGKAYRDHLKDQKYETVKQYAEEFFRFVEGSSHLFPREFQEKWFVSKSVTGALILMLAVTQNKEEFQDKNAAEKRAFARHFIEAQIERLEVGPFAANIDKEIVDTSVKNFSKVVTEELKTQPIFEQFGRFFNLSRLAMGGILSVYHEMMPGLDHTGLVFSGFGEEEYFPAAIVYDCYGLVLGKCLCQEKDGEHYQINHDSGSFVIPMAKSDMINTFVDGVGPGVLAQMEEILENCLDDYTSQINRAKSPRRLKEIETEKISAKEAFRNSLINFLITQHTIPMRRVVGMLPVDELSDLAETLIYVESLKERVTTPEETVSGPIDVAVISKGDGFIWIKRKHYFDPKLNPRYFQRRNFILGG